jgi:hypothetical protein
MQTENNHSLKGIDLLAANSRNKFQLPVLVANIWTLSKDLPRIMTCPKYIQKLLVLNQPGIIFNLHGSRASRSEIQAS